MITRMRQSGFAAAGYRMVLAATLLALSGCRQSVPAPVQQSERPATAAKDTAGDSASASGNTTRFPYAVTDGLGRTVTLARIPQRIVSLSPKNTEMLYAVGAGDQVVGTTTYCNYPPAAAATEKVGGFSAKSLSLERIVSLKPDVVMSVGDLHVPIIQELDRLQIPVIAFSADSFEGLFADLQLLGRVTGHEAAASALVSQLIERVERVQQAARKIPENERVTAFYYVWGEPLSGAGPTSYFGEMIELSGAVNVVEDTSTRFPRLTMEVLLAKNPDVIISSTNHSDLISGENSESRPGWSGLKAVQSKRVHLMDGNLISRCTPRTVDALELMAHLLYPAHFTVPKAESMSDPANGHQP
ncbi:MAG: ABC transporter substrate-binding protein [Planctomycetes bacterium]|nr:ABC transporter substrate-binding protein [Planctomycetota bacterium]